MTKVYEDHLLSISLATKPIAVGHLVVEPKEKIATIEDISDELMNHLFFGASYAATALFELAHAQGTNIILQEHDVRIHVIARVQDDGLDLMWQPTQGNTQELNDLAKSIKDEIDVLVWKKENPQKKSAPKEKEVLVDTSADEEDVDPSQGKKVNYLIRSLDRKP